MATIISNYFGTVLKGFRVVLTEKAKPLRPKGRKGAGVWTGSKASEGHRN